MPQKLCARWSLVDIAVNLSDNMFSGVYNGKQYHEPDVQHVLQRAVKTGVRGLLLTAGSLAESLSLIETCQRYNNSVTAPECLCTVGCHPTRCNEIEEYCDISDGSHGKKHREEDTLRKNDDEDNDVYGTYGSDQEICASAYMARVESIIHKHAAQSGQVDAKNNRCVVAIGECGLDYDRLQFCSKEVQKRCFARQLNLAVRYSLPVFLHNRNTDGDFVKIISQYRGQLAGGVVHSFTGTLAELHSCLALDLYIGINGCSLKTDDNIRVASQVPLSRLMIETDAPWCSIRNTHASRALLISAANRTPQEKYGVDNIAQHRCLSDAILANYSSKPKNKHSTDSFVKGRTEPSHLVQVLEVLYEIHQNKVDSIEALAHVITSNVKKIFPFTLN